MLRRAGVAVEYKIIMKYVQQLHLVLHFPPFKLWTIKKLCDKFYLTKYYWMFWFYSAIYLRVSVSQSHSPPSLSLLLSPFSFSTCVRMFSFVVIRCDFKSVSQMHVDLFSFYCCFCKSFLLYLDCRNGERVKCWFFCFLCLYVIPLRQWYSGLLVKSFLKR